MPYHKNRTKEEYQSWIDSMFGRKIKPKYTAAEYKQFSHEREAKRLIEAPANEAKWAEFVRIANLPPEPSFQEKGQMVRKIFYTSCSYILLKIILEIESFDIPHTFEIEDVEKHHFLHQIYTDLEPLLN